MMNFGCVVVGLGGSGKDSPVPVLGGLKADNGRRGFGLGGRRARALGEGGVGGTKSSELMVVY